MQINHEKVRESLNWAMNTRRDIESIEFHIKKLKNPEEPLIIRSGRNGDPYSSLLDEKTLSIIESIILPELEEKRIELVNKLQTIMKGGIQID